MKKVTYEQNLKEKHLHSTAELFNYFDKEAIPEDFMKILNAGKIEFICITHRSNIISKAAEICLIFPQCEVYRKIYVLYDYCYYIKYQEIPINEIKTREGRNAEIKRLYYEAGLTQLFIGRFFKLTQPSISLIVRKERIKNE